MTAVNFTLTYDGEALQNHEIEPSQLSSSILALETILKEANAVLNLGHNTSVKIKVKGSFESGSFGINWIIDINWLTDIFSSKEVTAVVNATTIFTMIFGSTTTSVVFLLKFLRGQRPDSVIINNDKTITIEKDKKYLTIEAKEYELIKNYTFRLAFEKLVSPLDTDGIESLYIRSKNQDTPNMVCNKLETSYFKCPIPEINKIDEPAIYDTRLSIISLSFKKGNEWYVNDGESNFYAIVEDNDFLSQIEQSIISFSKGDILKVEIRKEQFYDTTSQKLKSEYYIQKVKSHDKPYDLFKNH